MKQPIEPNKEDCCNSGCNPCIFDVYEKQLTLYKKYSESGNGDESDDNGISQLEYTPFVVIENLHLCESHRLLSFMKMSSEKKRVWWKPGHHFLVKYSSSQKQCSRAYTPVNSNDRSCKEADFSVIVKKYKQGLVSNYLTNLKPGEKTMWRGPYGNYELTANKFDRIIIIAQGTGVAPFTSIIEGILNNEDDMTKIILLYCCQSIDTVLFRDIFYHFKSYWNFSYQVFLCNTVSEECKRKYQEPLIAHRLSFTDLVKFQPFTKNEQFLLCGSTQFMEHYSKWLRDEDIPSNNIVVF